MLQARGRNSESPIAGSAQVISSTSCAIARTPIARLAAVIEEVARNWRRVAVKVMTAPILNRGARRPRRPSYAESGPVSAEIDGAK